MRHSRLLSLLSFATLLATGAPAVHADFYDVPNSASYAAPVESLQSQGFLQGYSDGSFRPNQRVNRAEFLQVLVRAAGRDDSSTGNVYCFTDFRGSERWYWSTACTARDQQIVDGFPDGSFRGDRFVTLSEAAKMAVNAFDVPLPQYFRAPDHWYDQYIDAISSVGVFEWISRDPSHTMTRADMAILIDSLMNGSGNNNYPPNNNDYGWCGSHRVGDTYPSGDGCNTCSCTTNGEACTLRACNNQNTCRTSNDCARNEYCSRNSLDCQRSCATNDYRCQDSCLGTCVRSYSSYSSSSSSASTCYNSNTCASWQRCSTERGDCRRSCTGDYCPQVCAGVCEDRYGYSSSSSYGNSCQQREQRINQVLSSYQYCSSDSDCSLFVQACSPYLTCGTPVNRSALSTLQSDVNALRSSCIVNNTCASCAQMSQQVRCDAGQCVVR